ncbi:MAG: 6-phosphogluconolactonase [Chlamydiae bacterium]|nr:6-phosphogluconolactonase [Chlamydiota bacterium]
MDGYHWKKYIESYDERRDAVIPGDKATTIQFCVDHFIRLAEDAIAHHGYFATALSGGSTPKAIFERLSDPKYRERIEWKRVLLFWSDERAVPPGDPKSNYRMAMDAGFGKLPVPAERIFRMKAEKDIEENALEYQKLIEQILPNGVFDLVMLGMGEDGHTASLFPKTHGLHTNARLVIANFIPSLDTWRMTLTYDCINRARNIVIYVIGETKAEILENVLDSDYDPDSLPVQRVGTPTNKALFITDNAALSDVYLK